MNLDALFDAVAGGRAHDPAALLGVHETPRGRRLRVFRPGARRVKLEREGRLVDMKRRGASEFFEADAAGLPRWPGAAIRLHVETDLGVQVVHDPYAFSPEPPHHDLYLFNEGTQERAYRFLGAHATQRAGVNGICFRVWAPNAGRVSVVGDFNRWDGRLHPMVSLGGSGVWELFVPGLGPGTLYKFELRHRDSGVVFAKADPFAARAELRPGTASIVAKSGHAWGDGGWMERRARADWLHAPMSCYEVHAGSWMRHPGGGFYGWDEMAERLVPHVKGLGFTHLEFLPLMEHPLDESWGYQPTGYFAPTSRFGEPDGLRRLVERCHEAGLGVLLDWVPAHFASDAWGLAFFDGTSLYEHEDPNQRTHPDWGTHVFNFGRREVQSFLLSSAHYWPEEFHVDGLRVDAVASMIYLDYSRRAGEWTPNRHGGRENLEAIEFLKRLNVMVHREFPGALTLAEESTAWPMVSRPVDAGGLGFSMKWNMGWMNDTLRYFARDPVHRKHHHGELTFGQLYSYTENFLLPLSHDEVVHGKKSLLAKMPGDLWQQLAGLRLLLAWQSWSPGKKLLFMGAELAMSGEWSERGELPWPLAAQPEARGIATLMGDLNRLHSGCPALHEQDFDQAGFAWIDCHDDLHSTLSWLRFDVNGGFVVAALNFTPVPRPGVALGVPRAGRYRELLNTDSSHYGGSNLGNGGVLMASPEPRHGHAATLRVNLPPLGGVLFAPE